MAKVLVAAALAAAIVLVVQSTVNRYYYGCSDFFRTCIVMEKPKL